MIGLLAGAFIMHPRGLDRRLAIAVVVLVFVAALLVGALRTELKVGFIAGVLLGLLLGATPILPLQSENL